MNNEARFALSQHVFRPHSRSLDDFTPFPGDGYTPHMLRRAYSFDENYTGRGIKIALICALDNVAITRNMEVFCRQFNLQVPEMQVFYPDGRSESTTNGWLVESSLDTQWAHVFAPDARLFVVFSRDASVDSLLSAARFACRELSADIVSMSFGSEESARDENISSFMADNGCIFVSSSGDVGGRVSFPSSSPFCISVGGTTLSANSAGERIAETAWNESGGGISNIFDIPFYQGRFFNIYGMTQGKRGVPDVAMSASDNMGALVYVSSLGGWTTVGGTSLSAACFAGVCACIKERHPEIMSGTDMLSFLYSKAGGDGYSQPQYNFYDITVGRSGEYYAERGWDFTTGLGSPVIRRLLL